ncbi:NrsF family protein [Frateuria defendens]|uniref:NrsF family protein n=1 Tax=Frateuria defendens TaxID=2219559 RepID=UPI00066FCE8D|nr:NrsF family protein [Frateuria defendens]
MSDPRSHHSLIAALGAELAPVRRLRPPWLRTLGWLAVVALIAAGLLLHYGSAPMLQRWRGAPDLAWAGLGAVLTAVAAAWAAFALAVPGRRAALAWLPLPGVLLWLGASGLGCLQGWIAPGDHAVGEHVIPDCLRFIVGFSVPLSVLLVWLLRRAAPLRPVLTAVLVGLASAAASASLLEICHNVDATATDLAVHVLAVGLVVAVNAALGGRLLGGVARKA